MTKQDKAVLTAMIKEARSRELTRKEQKLVATAISLYAQGRRDLCLVLLINKGFNTLFEAWGKAATEYVVKKEATK